ncbi:MAG TPA: zf-HC2 domain-containing protein [Thermoanaerobaculia bacterium]|jgi:hypothetical protein|nr:zf-HC2 domain-containing protein [Thermoanaerobaculia bacterium]
MNDRDSEDLRRAFTAPGGTAPRPEDCPSPETIWAAVHGELPPGELRDVVDHTAACPACAEDWRLAVEVEREALAAGDAGRAAPPLLFPHRWVRLAPLVAAAAAIVLLVVGLPLVHHDGPPTFRGQKKLVSRLAEGQALPRGNCLLVWSGPAGATYAVEVRTLIGTNLVTRRGLKVSKYQVPESSLAGFPSGTRLEWQVTATLPGKIPLRYLTSTFTLR